MYQKVFLACGNREMFFVEVNEETSPILAEYAEVSTAQQGSYKIITKLNHKTIIEKFRVS